MNKTLAGVYITLILAVLLLASWGLKIDGVVTTTILTIIGLISGVLFGFTFGLKKGK